MERYIEVQGARVHNLKNVSVKIPRNQMVVVTGVSGSGKSSLVFDTIYAEGQRRYVESLSAYARQFLERMDKPDVDHIKGISPALAIEQKKLSRTQRSTVSTVTEIHDYLRVLYARIGKIQCPDCGTNVKRDSVSSIIATLRQLRNGTRIFILFPIKPDPETIISLREKGFSRLWTESTASDAGEVIQLEESLEQLLRLKKAYVLVDRLELNNKTAERLIDSIETAFANAANGISIKVVDGEMMSFSARLECNSCGRTFAEPTPQLFSFNNPVGACPRCQGFGNAIEIDMDLVIPDRNKTAAGGAIKPWATATYRSYLNKLRRTGFPMNKPVGNLSEKDLDTLVRGNGDFPGILGFFDRLSQKMHKIGIRILLSKYRGYVTCQSCRGSRLRPEALSVLVDGVDLGSMSAMTIGEVYRFFETLKLSETDFHIARRVVDEIKKRATFLRNVGLDYLTLNRIAGTLSGGEAQRINLATSLGSSLVGSLYVLDEPTIGLHPRDTAKLIGLLQNLRDIGNTVLIVEHDKQLMQEANQIIDIGPRAGQDGGEVVFQGTYPQILANRKSLTGKYLSEKLSIELPIKRRSGKHKEIRIKSATQHNLKNIDVRLPLNRFVCVTGVSGSGKSTLIHEILFNAVTRHFNGVNVKVGRHGSVEGIDNIDAVELVDQSPIGKTPRSTPATYIKVFDDIRTLFASTPQSKMRGYKPGAFSFNVPGGRCETCQGDGKIKVEMQFLADLYLECEECKGRRYKKEILEVHYRGKSIRDIFDLTIVEAIHFFKDHKRIVTKLHLLEVVGLGYIHIGQEATTLSGGEAQRVKLASHLSEKKGKKALYIFDEPTTGLHFDDIRKLLQCFDRLIENGNSVVIIEHNLDVIKCADYIIDLGPEGGDEGGYLVAQGPPEVIVKVKESYTGRFLKPYLN